MADEENDRTEQPTSRKLEKAREEGNVAKSQEIPTAVVLAAALIVFTYTGSWMYRSLSALMTDSFRAMATTEIETNSLLQTLAPFLFDGLVVLVPLMLATMIVGSASFIAQFGLLFSAKPVTPDLNRINPGSGVKRLFSFRAVFDAIKGSAKVILVGYIVYLALRNNMDLILGLAGMPVPTVVENICAIAMSIALRVIIALAVLAAVDYLYQRHVFMEGQKMTRQEIKDEFKNTEGDPKVKARIRRIQMDMAHRRMMQDVPKANVVITNPTEIAVALRYDRLRDAAPVVLAKGKGFIAQKIREKAEQHRIPIVEKKPVAQEIYKRCRIGDIIPVHLYQAIAEILAFIYNRNRQGGAA